MLLNCDVWEDSWESLGLQGYLAHQSKRKSTLNIHWKDWCWSSSIFITWCKELIYKKRPWCWEKLKAGGEEGGRGWDSITDSINLNLSKLGESVEDGGAWCGAVHGVAKSQIRPSDRTIHEWWWKWAWNFQRPFGETELLGFWDSGKQGQKHHFKSVPGSVVQRKEHNPWPWMVLDSHPASPLTRLNVLG